MELYGEIKAKNMEVFSISAHPKDKVDEMIAKVGLTFKVKSIPRLFLDNP